jgi:hypothetical protein
VFDFFNTVLWTPPTRSNSISLEHLDLPCLDLSHLEERFTEVEVWNVINALPPDKAIGPDGFTT